MEWTGLNELREKYLAFFESKGHLRLPSFSLVPRDDKSLLLINSGMAPMKKYFTGEVTPPRKRVTTCQKCIRTPDIENVGKTARHGTYFEMLGNFSFGDYFKKEVIPWAWEFCTKVMEMDPERLYISVYEDDDEAYDIWTKTVGVDASHMVRFGKADNFWEHGAGPCGPCSEIYYDRGEKYGCGKPDCKVGCECDRYIEFWNLVFTQFENDGEGNYTRLAHPNIDTGMGLERLACIAQDVDNLFEVDTVQNIMKHIMEIAGVRYHEDARRDVSLRVITDHVRSTTMMLGDGVMPSNEGRGYVLRRLLRRAVRHGRLLGIARPFLYEVAETVIGENKAAYPELVEKHDYIVSVIRAEEENFARTLDAGVQRFQKMADAAKEAQLSGADAFLLSDTFGFPLDLTKDLLEERGMTVDEDEFYRLVAEQRDRARRAHKDAGKEAWLGSDDAVRDLPATEFSGYTAFSCPARVLAVLADGERAEAVGAGKPAVLVLDRTVFYGEGGGQEGDAGELCGDGFTFTVTNTTKTAQGVYLHHGSLTKGAEISVGAEVQAVLDADRRRATMRNHTAAHLLQAALRKVLGTHVEQAGQLVSPREMRFDFTHFSALTADELRAVEEAVNRAVLDAVPVETAEMPLEKAKELGAMALFSEKYGDVVRVVQIGDVSAELCGGTHVSNTAELGLFKITSESSVAAGVRRITAVTGTGILQHLADTEALLAKTAAPLKANAPQELPARAEAVAAELKALEKEVERLQGELNTYKTAGLLAGAVDVDGVKLIVYYAGDETAENLRALADTARSLADNAVAVVAGSNSEKGTVTFACACAKEAIARGAHAGSIVREVAKVAGGSGGGKPDMAMAGGKDVSKVDDALMRADEIVRAMLK
ncbi:MAG TPA: alanine--tRNA ligase [Candidatus Fimenecus excrementigallinarum]|uniref:Alanine--tRNA ligase n=1 Tax=Candidatus Fimenecus excrementigallinarum TaxID=2840816 RepID=A0A9D1IGS2_9FIRM|nr:alanine--tRNA ligase [Candidatus Fimenecus excrementigallinarum]